MTNKFDFVVVGGSAAGITAVEIIRNINPDATVAVVSDEDHEQYSRVLIPHYIRGRVSREQVFLKSSDWYIQKKIQFFKGISCQKLDTNTKKISLSSGEEIEYGKLLISVGGKVIPFAVPGADSKNLLYMRTIEDADKIITIAKQSKKAIIIGGGFIGLEMASCFLKNGVADITALVLEDFYWQGKLDSESSKVLSGVLVKNGVKIETKVSIDHFEVKEGLITCAVAKDGRRFDADMVGVGVGIRPDLTWLLDSGIKVDRGIVTNEYLETNIVDVYAAGDCTQFKDVIFEREHMLGNWANATSQGSVVGKTMSGQRTMFETASSYSISFFEPPVGGTCSFLGVTDEKFAEQIIDRGSAASEKISRIFVKKYGTVTRIVGATIINNPMEVASLTSIIKNKTDVGAYVADLAKVEFDLKTLI